jgi:hypothetical protein
MTLATTAHSTDASPRINAVRSARTAKTLVKQISPLRRFPVDLEETIRENLYHNYAGFVSP